MEQKKEELILANLTERKGDLGENQRLSAVRETLETDFQVSNKGREFEFILQMEREKKAPKGDCPVTSSTFYEVSEHQSMKLKKE